MRIKKEEPPFDENGDQLTMAWYHTNQYALESSCEVCGGVIRHETWCIETNKRVLEAFKAVLYGVEEDDAVRLAGLGVKWDCKGKCGK